MRKSKITFLFAILFLLETPALSYYPHFGLNPQWLPRGQRLTPLCTYPGSPSCMKQWSYQSQILRRNNSLQYYLPTFISQPSTTVDDPIGDPTDDDDWELFTPPSYGSNRRSSRKRGHRSRVAPVPKEESTPEAGGTVASPPAAAEPVPSPVRDPEVASNDTSGDEDNKGLLRVPLSKAGRVVSQKSPPVPAAPDPPPVKDPEVASNDTSGDEDNKGLPRVPLSKAGRVVSQNSLPVVPAAPDPPPVRDPEVASNDTSGDEDNKGLLRVPLSKAGRVVSQNSLPVPAAPNPPSMKEPKAASHPGRHPEIEVGTVVSQLPVPVAPAPAPVASSASSAAAPKIKPKFYRNKSNPDMVRVVEIDDRGRRKVMEGKIAFVDISDIERNDEGEYTTAKTTSALPTSVKEVQPGCFVIDKSQTETEASVCGTCDKEKEPVLSVLAEQKEFIEKLKKELNQVNSKVKDKIEKKLIKSSGDPQRSSLDEFTQKICHPHISLQVIISNFNSSCPHPYKNNFNKFFKETYCQACQQGVPPELMMSMMAVESSGYCKASNQSLKEHSIGLFQIDSEQHVCPRKKSGMSNAQCFQNPVTNMQTSIKILKNTYKNSNPQSIPGGQCKPWTKTTLSERNQWRRTVSSYNAGSLWLSRAIYSIRDERTIGSTKYLSFKHKDSKDLNEYKKLLMNEYKNHEASWEELRVYYFVEKLSLGNKTGSGREMKYTRSNVIHTEMVLGREVKGTPPGLVEVWGEYVRKNKPSCN